MKQIPAYTAHRMKLTLKYLSVAVWMGAIFLFSAEVADDSKARSGIIVGFLKDSLNVDFADDFLSFLTRKAAHIIAYFILGLLVHNLVKTYKLTTKKTITLSILIALLYATFDEIHQLFVPGRSGEIRDVLIDTAAASVGVSAYYLCNKIHYNRKNSKSRI